MAKQDAGATSGREAAGEERAAPASRDQARSRTHRSRPVRGRTISVKRMARYELEVGRALYPPDEHADVARPTTRADCEGGERPCPFVACRHHLYLDVSAKTGAIKLNFPDLEPDELEVSCALDIAGLGEATLDQIGDAMNLTRERVRQLEARALAKVGAACESRAFRDVVEDRGRPSSRRQLPVLQEEPPDSVDFDVEAFASDALDGD